jgi:repressor LexA
MLTAKQQAVLDVIRDHTVQYGYPPTVREIGSRLGLASSSTVHAHLSALERAGLLARDPSKPRALKLADAVRGSADEHRDGARDTSTGMARADASRSHADHEHATAWPMSPADVHALPVLGAVAAGAPLLAENHVEDVVPVPASLTRSGTSFVLKVRGDSMVDAGILDGDHVVVRQQPDAATGQIVVALIEDEATCKRLLLRDGRVELHSENPAYAPIVPDHCRILGVVTGVMRAL